MIKSHSRDTEIFLENFELQAVEARCFGVAYNSRRLEEVWNVAGQIVCKSSIVPPVYIQDKVRQLHLLHNPLWLWGVRLAFLLVLFWWSVIPKNLLEN